MIESVNQFINFFRTFLSFAMVFETRLTACDTVDPLKEDKPFFVWMNFARMHV